MLHQRVQEGQPANTGELRVGGREAYNRIWGLQLHTTWSCAPVHLGSVNAVSACISCQHDDLQLLSFVHFVLIDIA
jgi:hypothetical protein